jgi:hypothetical protein
MLDQESFAGALGWGGEHGPRDKRPSHVLETKTLDQWDRVLNPDVNLLIHDWQPSLGLRLALAQLPLDSCPERQLLLNAAQLKGLPRSAVHPLEKALFSELSEIIERFVQVTEARTYQLIMARAEAQMCPLFHVDKIPMRLFVTLRGPGTEWLDNRDVYRPGLGKGDNTKIMRCGATIHRLAPFQVGLMKGENGLGLGARGIVHRSPALWPDEQGRWFLKIDARRSSVPGALPA